MKFNSFLYKIEQVASVCEGGRVRIVDLANRLVTAQVNPKALTLKPEP